MPTVDLITYCCPKDIHRTYAGWKALRSSFLYPFHEVILIRQRCRDIDVGSLGDPTVRILETEDYPNIYAEFGVDENDPIAARVSTVGTKFYWKYLCMNQFIGLYESIADYIAFTDCDNLIGDDVDGNSWIHRGLKILQEDRTVFMVCPSHGSSTGNEKTKVISQCMFLCERERFLNLDYNAPLPKGMEWNNFYFEFEGMLWRYAQNHGVWRMMLEKPPVLIHQAW